MDTYFREVCGQPNLLDDATRPLTDAYYYLDSGHAVFTRRPDGGWTVTPAPSNALGAQPVTWFEGGVFRPFPSRTRAAVIRASGSPHTIHHLYRTLTKEKPT